MLRPDTPGPAMFIKTNIAVQSPGLRGPAAAKWRSNRGFFAPSRGFQRSPAPPRRDWAGLEGCFVSIVYADDGATADLSAKRRLADCVLSHRRLIGHRRWGMIQLYYRAGLSQREIAEIFGINRQMVSYELKQAFRLVSEYLESRRRREKQREPAE